MAGMELIPATGFPPEKTFCTIKWGFCTITLKLCTIKQMFLNKIIFLCDWHLKYILYPVVCWIIYAKMARRSAIGAMPAPTAEQPLRQQWSRGCDSSVAIVAITV
jgi:hypothetical protein